MAGNQTAFEVDQRVRLKPVTAVIEAIDLNSADRAHLVRLRVGGIDGKHWWIPECLLEADAGAQPQPDEDEEPEDPLAAFAQNTSAALTAVLGVATALARRLVLGGQLGAGVYAHNLTELAALMRAASDPTGAAAAVILEDAAKAFVEAAKHQSAGASQ